MPQIEADLISTIRSFSRAGDLNKLTFLAHAERVTHIAYQIGQTMQLSEQQLEELILSSLLHDLGILTDQEQLLLADLEPRRDQVSAHCRRGCELLKRTQLFAAFAQNVLEHHDFYSPQLRLIPAIIHVADRVDILLDKRRYYLWQVDDILDYFESKAGSVFCPEVIDALRAVAQVPAFWFDLEQGNYRFQNGHHHFRRVLTLDELEELARLMATIVDSKSPFTADHSQGVTMVAGYLGDQLGFSEEKLRLLKIAGLLHDIGKLAISDEILMHPGALNRAQRQVMKQHTYHTYYLLRAIGPGSEKLAEWAAYHHERLNGTGYPFALSAPQLDQEARLMAVADITQSLLEDRPYRPALDQDKVTTILHNNVQAGHIDGELTDLAIAHLDQLRGLMAAPSQSN